MPQPNDPNLVHKALAKAQSIEGRLNDLVNNSSDTAPSITYGTTSTVVTQSTAGSYTWLCPSGVTSVKVECWGAGGGGYGSSATQGGSAGGGGEYAAEPAYPVSAGTLYSYTVGAGGLGAITGAGGGTDGGNTFFDFGGSAGGVIGYEGDALEGSFIGGAGGAGSTNSVESGGGAGGNGSGFTGGASGGNSGCPTASGNGGLQSTSSTHAGAPPGQTGAGTGGAGGDAGSNGTNGSSPGGGGGGGGAAAGGGTNIDNTYTPSFTASFYGPDATGGNANKTRSTSTLYQGGETASGGGANGNQRCVIVFPSNTIASDFSGATPKTATLTLHCQHSWYNSGMLLDVDMPNTGGKVTTPPGVWPNDVNQTFTFSIVPGQTKSFSLGSAVAGHFISNDYNFIALGGFVASRVPYDLTYYGYLSGGGNPTLRITGTTAGGSPTTSGNGADGQIKITYASTTIPVTSTQPVAVTDSSGNAVAAGFTGQSTAFQPGQIPSVVETWHNMTLTNSWTTTAGNAQYKLGPDNRVYIRGENLTPGTLANGTSIWTIPTGYIPTKTQPIVVVIRSGATFGTMPRLEATTGGQLQLEDFGGTVNALYFQGSYPLD